MSLLKRSYFIFVIACIITLFPACNEKDDNFNGLVPAETNKMYTNKLASASSTNQLVLTYNGNTFSGKNVYFELMGKNRAEMDLKQILPGEKETIVEITNLKEIKEGGYSFSGTNTTQTGTTFSYSGSIIPGKLTLQLTDIQLAQNPLSSEAPWYNKKTSLTWQLKGNNLLWSILTPILSNLLDNLLLSVLHDITFLPDGNIVAAFAPLPKESDIAGMIGSTNYNDRDEADWQTSPANMAIYYIKEDKLYVVPQVEMLIQTLLIGQTRADLNEIVDLVISLLSTTSKWSNEGIEFSITHSGDNVFLILDKSQIEFLFPLLSYIGELIPADILPEEIGNLLEELLADAAVNTSEFKLTINLSKTK